LDWVVTTEDGAVLRPKITKMSRLRMMGPVLVSVFIVVLMAPAFVFPMSFVIVIEKSEGVRHGGNGKDI
jgi:hypothetical protein